MQHGGRAGQNLVFKKNRLLIEKAAGVNRLLFYIRAVKQHNEF
jgi:hypothetical protein